MSKTPRDLAQMKTYIVYPSWLLNIEFHGDLSSWTPMDLTPWGFAHMETHEVYSAGSIKMETHDDLSSWKSMGTRPNGNQWCFRL